MERLVELEQDVVRCIDDVVDRPLANGGQPFDQPCGAGRDVHSTDDRDHVPGRAFRIFQPHFDTVDLARDDAAARARTAAPAGGDDALGGRRRAPLPSTRNRRELYRRAERRAQLTSDSLVTE